MARRQDFKTLVRKYRGRLEALYTGPGSDDDKRRGKAALYAAMRDEVATYKRERWNGWGGYDAWFARANNAAIGAQAAYDDQVPVFERLFHRAGDDFPRFYDEVKRLAALDRVSRDRALAAVAAEAATEPPARDGLPVPASSAR